MNLAGLKKLVWDYEKALGKLKHPYDAQKLRPETWVLTVNGDSEIPVSLEYAETALQEYIWALEAKAKEQASVLGIEGLHDLTGHSFVERANLPTAGPHGGWCGGLGLRNSWLPD